MLSLPSLEEIQDLLLRVPPIIQQMESHRPGFVAATRDWLTQMEQVLVSNRSTAAAEIAVLRGVLIAAERGVIPAGIVFGGRATSRKVREASAADVLRQAEAAVSDAIRGDVAQMAEGERLARQIAAVAVRKGLWEAAGGAGGHSQRLMALWQAMGADPELGNAVVRLTGLVGLPSALALLDRALPLVSAAN
jgi:hypothetical protein